MGKQFQLKFGLQVAQHTSGMSRSNLRQRSRIAIKSDGVDGEAAAESLTVPSFRPRPEIMRVHEEAKLAPLDDPYFSSDKLTADGGEHSFTLPNSVYTSVIVGWLNQDD